MALRVRLCSPSLSEVEGSEAEGLKMKEKVQPWFVYILRCNDGSYYVGVATDVEDRVREHNSGQGPTFTKKRRPVKLTYAERHESHANARKREAQLKGWRREKKEWLIHGFPSTRPSVRQAHCPSEIEGRTRSLRSELRVEDRA